MKMKVAKGSVFMATSLDGFVAREDHNLDWLMKYNTGGEDQGYDEFISKIDVIVMGSGSFKTVLDFDLWPYQLPVHVMSKTLTQQDVPERLSDSVFITEKSPRDLMESLYQKGNLQVYVDGGKIVQSFLQEGLVNEITITQIPILIGSGKRLFGELIQDIDLELLNSKSFKVGFVQNHYRVVKSS